MEEKEVYITQNAIRFDLRAVSDAIDIEDVPLKEMARAVRMVELNIVEGQFVITEQGWMAEFKKHLDGWVECIGLREGDLDYGKNKNIFLLRDPNKK